MQLHFDVALAVMLASQGAHGEVETLLERLGDTESEKAHTSVAKLRRWVDSRTE